MKPKILYYLFAFIIFVVLIIYSFKQSIFLEKNGVYTSATISKIEPARGGFMLTLKYSYNNIQYKNSYIEDAGTVHENMLGKKYLIKIRKDQPDANFELYLNSPIP